MQEFMAVSGITPYRPGSVTSGISILKIIWCLIESRNPLDMCAVRFANIGSGHQDGAVAWLCGLIVSLGCKSKWYREKL